MRPHSTRTTARSSTLLAASTRSTASGLLLWILLATPASISAQDIVPLAHSAELEDTATRRGIRYVDATALGEGTWFYEAETLNIRLLDTDPVFTFQNTFATDQYFYGESDDSMASLSLMRYTPPTTKTATDVVRNVLTGILHDRQKDLFYEIRQDELGRQTVRVTAEDDVPPTADPKPLSSSGSWSSVDRATPIFPTLYNRVRNYVLGPKNNPTTIDIMVIWSQSSECYHSSLDTGCGLSDATQGNMEAVVALMVEETNTALANSQTGLVIRLVHRQRETSGYVEPGMRTTLDHITNLDGTMDYIHGIRDEFGADLVQFIVDNRIDPDRLGGVAWLPRTLVFPGCYDSAAGYSVVCAQCMTNYVSAHEFGHNLGCNHDRGTSQACTVGNTACGGATNYGYRSPQSTFRTIMAYRCVAGECDNNPGASCPRIPYFSGDAAYTNGESLGGSDNSCRQEIGSMMAIVANYRTCSAA